MPQKSTSGRYARRVAAFGEIKSVWQWARDERCFLTAAGLAYRIERFPRELTETDAEAAMCLLPRLWSRYLRHGTVPQEMIDELD